MNAFKPDFFEENLCSNSCSSVKLKETSNVQFMNYPFPMNAMDSMVYRQSMIPFYPPTIVINDQCKNMKLNQIYTPLK